MTDVKLGDLFWQLGVKSTVNRDISKAEKSVSGLDKTSKKSQSSMKSLTAGMKVAGAAATGLGLAIIGLTDSAKKTNAALGVTAFQLGVSTEEMRDLALATTNVTFPLEEVQKSFDLLTRAGIRNTEELQTTAMAYDTLGDAVDHTASEIAGPMITAMKTFGLEMAEGANYTDQMTYLLRYTTLELGNFSSVIAKITPELVEMGLTMDDTIAILGVLESKGVAGEVAVRTFERAITSATNGTIDWDATLSDLADTMLNLKDEQDNLTDSVRDTDLSLRSNALSIANAKDRLAEMQSEGKKAGETTEQYNRRLEEQKIRIESLGYRQEDLKKKQAETTAEIDANAEAQAANIEIQDAAAASMASGTSGMDVFYETLGVTNEEIAAYKEEMGDAEGITQDFADEANKQHGVIDNLRQSWEEWSLKAGSALEPLEGVGGALSLLGPLMMGAGGVGPAMQALSGIQLKALVPSLWATASAGLAAIAPWLPLIIAIGAVIAIGYLLWDNWEEISAGLGVLWDGLSELAGTAWDSLTSVISGALDLLWNLFLGWTPLGIFISHFDEILEFMDTLKDLFYNAGTGIMQFLIDGLASMAMAPFDIITDAFGFVADLLPHSPAKIGPLSHLPNWDAYLVEPLDDIKPAMRRAATAAITPVAVSSSNQQSTVNNDNSLSINQITFQNPTDIQEFWRRRDEQIRSSKYQRGVRS